MKQRLLTLTMTLSGTALAAVLVLPALAQESLLPEGFGGPSDPPAQRPAPRPSPAPSASPTPSPGSSSSASRPSTGSTGTSASGTTGATVSGATTTLADGTATTMTTEPAQPATLRYDLPPGARRLLTRIGPLTVEDGGFPSTALGTRGEYAEQIMINNNGQIASRWGQILLRRALVSSLDTPATVNGADLAAARAGLLLRMGESVAARWIVQAVDFDRASPRLVAAAQQVYLANADPAGLCPYVPAGLGRTKDESWRLAAAMCSALQGEPGPAGWAVGKVRSSGKIANFDILLTERVLGAANNGRRSTTIEWDKVDKLTSWRFGLATATATSVPAPLRASAPGHMRGWTVLAPMTDMADRIAAAPEAAARGVLSSEAYVSLLGSAAGDDDANEATENRASQLRAAFAAATGAARYTGMQALWAEGQSPSARYAGLVLTARAAAALPVSTDVGDDPWQLVGSMLAGGYDRNAMAWVPTVSVGSRSWGILAVGSPRPLNGTNAGAIDSFSGDDDSKNYQRSKLLLAGLAGLGRINAGEMATASRELGVDLNRESRWTKAIDDAASRGEPGLVALLAATGMQGNWADVPPHHLYRIVKALREVGLASEARMIAAEALVRV